MAIRERKGRASPFQVYWNNPFTGKRESANFQTRLEAEKHDSLIKHRLKFDRESFRKEEEVENEKSESELTLEQAYLLYLREKQFNKKGLEWQLGSMRIALKLYGNWQISALDYKEFMDIMEKLKGGNVADATVRGCMSVLRTVIRWSAEQGFCQIPRFPKLPAAQYKKFIPPTPEELAMLLHAAEPHIVRVILLGSQCGIRVGPSELLRLEWADVDLCQKVIRVRGAKKNPSAPWREVPIKESLLPLLTEWRQSDLQEGMPYVIHFNGKQLQSIKRAWKNTLQRASITRRIRPYDLRHAFATELIAAGTDIGTVAKLMGHSSPVMILNHYQYIMDKQKREAIANLPDLAYVPKTMCPNEKGIMEKS